MPKPVLQELSEADSMHALAVKMRKQGDTVSADRLERKVKTKRGRAITRMGKRVKNANTSGRPRVVATGGSHVRVT